MSFKFFFIAIILTVIYLLVVVLAVVYMQPDYFVRIRTTALVKNSHGGLWWVAKIFKNILGILLIIVGGVMLITPGQGLFTILLGVLLADFPGKRRIERALVRHPSVCRSINWIRRKASKPPIEIP